MAAGVRCVEMIPYVICPCQGVQQKSFWRLVEGGRAWQRARGEIVASRRAGVLTRTGAGLGAGAGCAGLGARARVVLGGGCAVCGILRVWAVGVCWFLWGGWWCVVFPAG